MGKKIAGKINQPPKQVDFDKIGLADFCKQVSGEYYRLHSTDSQGSTWPPLDFSRRGNSRFDPKSGVGRFALEMAGVMMELFDDHWGPVGSIGRSVTETQLKETWVTRVSLPEVILFDATGANLSKIGTDAQLLTGDYATTRNWAERMMKHPVHIDGILFRSRHDLERRNIAVFRRAHLLPEIKDPNLRAFQPDPWTRDAAHGSVLVWGSSVRLVDHPELPSALSELQVARLP